MSDLENAVASYIRLGQDENLLFVFNFTPVPRSGYLQGAPTIGKWRVLLSSDEVRFGGSGAGSSGDVLAKKGRLHNREAILSLDLPPLGVLILRKA